jgi:hypothetical protein
MSANSRLKVRKTYGRAAPRGGHGRDALLAGAGDDFIEAKDGEQDDLECDSSNDVASVDLGDRVACSCEMRSPSCLCSSYAPYFPGRSRVWFGANETFRRSLWTKWAESTFSTSRRIGKREGPRSSAVPAMCSAKILILRTLPFRKMPPYVSLRTPRCRR